MIFSLLLAESCANFPKHGLYGFLALPVSLLLGRLSIWIVVAVDSVSDTGVSTVNDIQSGNTMKKNIRLVTPLVTEGFWCEESDLGHIQRDDLVLSHLQIEYGPISIESAYEEAICKPATIGKVIEAE